MMPVNGVRHRGMSAHWDVGTLDPVGSRFVRNVSMVGVSGSGKSTLGRELATRLAVPYAELDAVFHQPEWTPLPEEDFRRRVSAFASGNGWVIDGNYSAVLPLVWEHADTVVWLDPPRRTVMRRIIWRSLRRVAGRTELWNGNRERWRNLLTWDERESVISWAWHHHPIYRQRYAAAARDPRYAHLTFHRIATRADASQLLASAC
jgi:adenylate kinase family enzyme